MKGLVGQGNLEGEAPDFAQICPRTLTMGKASSDGAAEPPFPPSQLSSHLIADRAFFG
jgi:hypothetical protein